MTVAATFRWKVANVDSARKSGKIASEVWTKAGGTRARAFLVMAGPNVENWLFALEFPDLGPVRGNRAPG